MSSTWLEIRQQILTLLDLDPDATTESDLRNVVDLKIKHSRDRLYNLRPPASLLVKSATVVTIDENTVYVSLTETAFVNRPTFLATDLRKVYAVLVNEEEWDYMTYGQWISQNNHNFGDQRHYATYTIDADNHIYFKTLPGEGETWDVELVYYKEPSTIYDGGIPDLDPAHHELLVCDVVRKFPHRFVTEQQMALYAQVNADYRELMKLFMQDSPVGKMNLRMKPALRKRNRASIWGS